VSARLALRWVQPAHGRTQHQAYATTTTTLCGQPIAADAVWSNRAHAPCAECQARDPERASYIDYLLEYIEGARACRPRYFKTHEQVETSPRFFDRAEPLLAAELTHGDKEIRTDLTPRDVRWPMDMRVITRSDDEDLPDDAPPEDHTDLCFLRLRGLDARAARGRLGVALPYPIEFTSAFPKSGESFRILFGLAAPGHWRDVGRRGGGMTVRSVSADEDLIYSPRFQIYLGLWALRPRQWRVYFALDEHPGIELPTDPVGARAAFRLRDLPAGQGRRAALRHWVTEHWRQSRDDAAEERLVREHLRGERRFAWHGLHCEITPSLDDQARAATAAADRATARRDGTDRRPRRP
jgi:hypothetical protein